MPRTQSGGSQGACGPILRVDVDGELIFCAADDTFASGSIALYSWGNAGSSFDDVRLDLVRPVYGGEDFQDGSYDGWMIVDEATIAGPSVWSAATGQMVQTSNIFGGDALSLDMPGTYALYEDGLAWDDYILTLAISSDDDDAIGVMFRYQDGDNYYRFSWDRQRRYRRLVKKEDGAFTLLAEDDAAYVTGQTYDLEVVVCGPQLRVFVDDALIFWVSDDALRSGTIALYSWGNSGSHFDDVFVDGL